MNRLDRATLRERIFLGLTAFRPMFMRKRLGLDVEKDREALAEELTHRIMGPSEGEAVILLPSRVGNTHTHRPGVWNVDEPHPAPDVPLAGS